MTTKVIGRLAPTPSGELHLGNVLSFAAAWLSVRQQQGTLLLRVEDIDQGRARAQIADHHREDLEWLGLTWDAEVLPQSQRDYEPWITHLNHSVYRCRRSRAEFRADTDDLHARSMHLDSGTLRFMVPHRPMWVRDRRHGPVCVDLSTHRDPVLQRRDGVFAYTLAVVVDDLMDGVTDVVRGSDLLEVTAVQQALWLALGATPPSYLHSPLLRGPDGRKLGKSHGSTAVRDLRDNGWSPEQLWENLLPVLGIHGVGRLESAIPLFSPTGGDLGPLTLHDEPSTPGSIHFLSGSK